MLINIPNYIKYKKQIIQTHNKKNHNKKNVLQNNNKQEKNNHTKK